ncbi:MAG TPA: hypothetical protein VE891_00490 [Allosphingosinicella sp.]|nr:hypothetical protein [Allosphingosinicella sp.]
MRNPARKALYALLALIVSAVLIRFGIERYETAGEGWGSTGPILLGLAVLPFPLWILIQASFAVRGQAKLLAGIGVIARWQAYPSEWEQFRKLDSRRAGEDFSLGNELWIRRTAPTEPVEVIVGEKSALVDGSYHSLNPRGLPELRGVSWIEGPPTCLEFRLLYPRGRYGGTVPTSLRIPVPASARAAAVQVFDHFERLTRRSPGLALRNPSRTYRICAALFLGAAVAGGIGYALFGTLSEDTGQLVLMSLLIVAAVLATFTAIIALSTFLLTRRQ